MKLKPRVRNGKIEVARYGWKGTPRAWCAAAKEWLKVSELAHLLALLFIALLTASHSLSNVEF